jgi:hypothetical protein
MVHQRQRLALRFKTCDHLLAVHAGFDDLEGHGTADGIQLLSTVDHAHAAAGDLLSDFVVPDISSRLDRCFALIHIEHGGRSLHRRVIEKVACLRAIMVQQRLDFTS